MRPVRNSSTRYRRRDSGAWRELRATLELVPWNGRPANPEVPDGIQTWVFGEHGQGILYYLVLEDQQRVEILAVRWFD